MTLGAKIRQLRQARDWTQAELAAKVGVHQKQVSSYERGGSYPTTEVLIKLAQAFDVSLDYLALEDDGSAGAGKIKDRELLHYFEAIDNFPDEQKAAAKQVLDLLVMRSKVKELSGAAG